MANLPGGMILSGFGGNIAFNKRDGTGFYRVDVAGWELENIHINKECPHSGSVGAISRRRTGLDWKCKANIWFTAGNSIERYLRSGWGFETILYLSSHDAWLGYGVTESYYYSPSALLDTIRTIDNSDGKDIIRQEITFSGNSLLFLLPEEQTAWDNYYSILSEMGEI
jgi:hypothetical protein